MHSNYLDKSSESVVSGVIPSDDQKQRLDIKAMNGIWFHILIAISFDQQGFYLKSLRESVAFSNVSKFFFNAIILFFQYDKKYCKCIYIICRFKIYFYHLYFFKTIN